MNVSVALCTWNSEQFLQEQLASLAAQRHQPCELVVCDEGSTDGTIAIVRRFAESVAFPARLSINASRLGVTKNFEQAINLCTGDVIALADHDDVWRPEKLARAVDVLEQNPDVGLVFSDADVTDASLQPLGYSLWESGRVTDQELDAIRSGNGLSVLIRHQIVTGATATFRTALRPIITPIPESWMHDGWIAFMTAAVGQIMPIRERLMLYRQHGGNQIGGVRVTTGERIGAARRDHLRQWSQTLRQRLIDAHARLRSAGLPVRDPRVFDVIDAGIAHFQCRATLPDNRLLRAGPVARELVSGRYTRYSAGLASAAADLLL